MADVYNLGATFSKLQITGGKAVATFDLDSMALASIPDLARITGMPVAIDVRTSQRELELGTAVAIDSAHAQTLALGA